MGYKYSLFIYNSEQDKAGNCYWAFCFVDHKTKKSVTATFGGGDGNAYGILRHWDDPNDWDRSILVHREQVKIRAFNAMVKEWSYAGSQPEDLAAFIRAKLAEKF